MPQKAEDEAVRFEMIHCPRLDTVYLYEFHSLYAKVPDERSEDTWRVRQIPLSILQGARTYPGLIL